MKLLFCPDCFDVVKLDYNLRRCKCGNCAGKYEADGLHAVVNGGGMSLMINNIDLMGTIPLVVRKVYNIECCIRPHSGNHNPNTRVDPDLGKFPSSGSTSDFDQPSSKIAR